jgi:hypothetical protein
MAKSVQQKKTNIKTSKLSFKSPGLLIAVLFVIGFGGFGLWKLFGSEAAVTVPSFVRYGTPDRLQTYYTKGVEIVSDDLGGYNYNVAQLDANDILMFDGGRATPFTTEKQTCYSMRSLDRLNPAKVTISDGISKSRIITVVSDLGDGFASEYRDYCVSTAAGQTIFDFDVKHLSGGAVNVFQKRQIIQHCPDLNTPCH